MVEARDPKGLYKKARAGEIKGKFCLFQSLQRVSDHELDFTGVSAPYEAPEKPEIHLKTDESDVTESVQIITQYLTDNGFV